jgi:hypothetical protein
MYRKTGRFKDAICKRKQKSRHFIGQTAAENNTFPVRKTCFHADFAAKNYKKCLPSHSARWHSVPFS